MSTVIKVENLSKQYRLGEVGTGTISHDLNRWWAKIRGKDDPFATIGDTNDRTTKANSDYVWALKDIDFNVNKGDVFGIIGRNGAGKSTLLKILSRTTLPTTGSLKAKGRIASLLEVGTGFHPELTGRENVYQNGALLGMTKREITSKFDEIVDFSGVERYIDTPVKRYSSGMYVRLAFAVAAHLESEILIVDEVLAVGDAEFQKKCLGKMGDMSKNEGRTVLLVSHNMSAIKTLCTKGLFLKNGTVAKEGEINDVVNYYLSSYKDDTLTSNFAKQKIEDKDVELIAANIYDTNGVDRGIFEIFDTIKVDVTIRCKNIIPNTFLYILVQNDQEEKFIECDSFDLPPNILENMKLGNNEFQFDIPNNLLPMGYYTIYFCISSTYSNNFLLDVVGNVLKFEVVDSITQRGIRRKSCTSYLTKINLKNAK